MTVDSLIRVDQLRNNTIILDRMQNWPTPDNNLSVEAAKFAVSSWHYVFLYPLKLFCGKFGVSVWTVGNNITWVSIETICHNLSRYLFAIFWHIFYPKYIAWKTLIFEWMYVASLSDSDNMQLCKSNYFRDLWSSIQNKIWISLAIKWESLDIFAQLRFGQGVLLIKFLVADEDYCKNWQKLGRG